ncbi:MAG: hypothetical protein A2Y12_04060 [Planctomycetes bacterium GWF2_42_9]|nr:MAG: hypothetical protein A2Y12_04060 [Planctomycetes bacterium GWF2_42_9]
MDISIVIVSWNTREILRNCLDSIYKNRGDLEMEVIVVDNASGDRSAEMVREDFKDAIVIANRDNKGFAAGNNQGIAIARGEWILLLNSDTVVLGDALQKTLVYARANPRAGVVGCRILNVDMSLQRSCFKFPSILNMSLSASYLYKVFGRSRFFGRERMTWWDFNEARLVDCVCGAFMLIRSAAIQEVGLMDEGFFMYAEETDYCWRFSRARWEIRFCPDGEIIHLGGQSSAKVRGPMVIQLRLSILRFIRKHYGRGSYWMACLLVGIFFAARLPYWWAVKVFDKHRSSQAQVLLEAYTSGISRALGGSASN